MLTRFATLVAALALVASAACESEPPYQSQRCKELRARVRMIATLRASRLPTGDLDIFGGSDAAVDAKVREWMDEQPECFDPSL